LEQTGTKLIERERLVDEIMISLKQAGMHPFQTNK
jgi:hypothetical protein